MSNKVKFRFSLSIEDAVREAVDSLDLVGLGADGTSEYEVSDVSVEDEGGFTYTCVVELDRQAGKFVANDELEAIVTEALGDITVTIDYV
jgi:hypothetical protein